ncbi:hypothetical protein EJ08DRAFT_657610 [Tothia fuscella]|uniref:Uncharacterized protein n=1 Tax=Tothia fuscella TaxID=1048955 RepID=A0A9P4NYX3_9PEZI|nr:hypothetical protein EJ08DRAFT_657610 [Tothia fuscella]
MAHCRLQVRNQITELVITLPDTGLGCPNTSSCFDLTCLAHKTNPIPPPITHVNRQLRKETLQKFYDLNVIRVNLEYFNDWVFRMRTAGLQLPPNVHIQIPKYDFSKSEGIVILRYRPLPPSNSSYALDVTPLIRMLNQQENASTAPKDNTSDSNRKSAPEQLLEIASFNHTPYQYFKPSQSTSSSQWRIGFGHTDLTKTSSFWMVVRDQGWSSWVSPDGASPAFVQKVYFSPIEAGRTVVVGVGGANVLPSDVVFVGYDERSIMVRDCGSTKLLSWKVMASLGRDGLAVAPGDYEFYPVNRQLRFGFV